MTQPDLLQFAPVTLARRARGWSSDAQKAFIAALSRCGVVAQAARSVGCSPRSAYYLRARPGAESFAAAWDWALEMGLDESRGRAITIAKERQERPIVRRGQVVGTRTQINHRLLFAALRALGADCRDSGTILPHRERIATRHMLARLAQAGPYSPEEWQCIHPILMQASGAMPPSPAADPAQTPALS